MRLVFVLLLTLSSCATLNTAGMSELPQPLQRVPQHVPDREPARAGVAVVDADRRGGVHQRLQREGARLQVTQNRATTTPA